MTFLEWNKNIFSMNTVFKQRRSPAFSNKILNICFGLVVLIWHTWVYTDPEMVLIVIGLIFFPTIYVSYCRHRGCAKPVAIKYFVYFFSFFFHPKLSLPLPGLKHSQKKPKAVFLKICTTLCNIYSWNISERLN